MLNVGIILNNFHKFKVLNVYNLYLTNILNLSITQSLNYLLGPTYE